VNHYQTLQVNPQASQQEIKQAYRRLAKRFHPDSQTETTGCEKIIALNTAYEVIGNVQHRRIYDRQRQLGQTNDSFVSRQARAAEAHQQYQRQRETARPEISYQQWICEVYIPIVQLVSKILNPLETEIDELAADPFDDGLMADFEAYLQNCNYYWQQAQEKLSSLPNPAQLAGVAANLYYCLNHIGDGIKELEWFILNYNDHYLHTGQEIFRIASKLYFQAQEKVEFTV
jgi:molecular chaperone DnaJ